MTLNFSGVIPPDRERVITSFDFIDIAKNRALETFYGVHTFNATFNGSTITSTDNYSIVNNAIESSRMSTRSAEGNGAYARRVNVTFENKIDTNFLIEGDGIIMIPFGTVKTFQGNNGMSAFISASVLISGSSLKTLGEGKSEEITGEVTGTNTITSSIKFNAQTTKVKPGDYLQLKTEVWGKLSEANGDKGQWYLGHDPAQRTTTEWNDDAITFSSTAPTDLKVLIPIKIDI